MKVYKDVDYETTKFIDEQNVEEAQALLMENLFFRAYLDFIKKERKKK